MSISEFVGGGYGQWRMTEEKSNKSEGIPEKLTESKFIKILCRLA